MTHPVFALLLQWPEGSKTDIEAVLNLSSCLKSNLRHLRKYEKGTGNKLFVMGLVSG